MRTLILAVLLCAGCRSKRPIEPEPSHSDFDIIVMPDWIQQAIVDEEDETPSSSPSTAPTDEEDEPSTTVDDESAGVGGGDEE